MRLGGSSYFGIKNGILHDLPFVLVCVRGGGPNCGLPEDERDLGKTAWLQTGKGLHTLVPKAPLKHEPDHTPMERSAIVSCCSSTSFAKSSRILRAAMQACMAWLVHFVMQLYVTITPW